MDHNGYMSSGADSKISAGGTEASRKALELIGQMRPRLKMADGWFKTISRIHSYYMRIKKDFRRNMKVMAAQGDSNAIEQLQKQLTLREGGGGGGADEWNLIRKTILEFGSLEDEDLEMQDAPALEKDMADVPVDTGRQSTTGSPDSNTVRQGGWASINVVPNGLTGGHRASDASNSNAPAAVNGSHNAPASTGQEHGLKNPNLASPTSSEIATPRNALHGYGAQPSAASARAQPDTIGFASVEDARNASLNLQQQVNSISQRPQQPPTLSALVSAAQPVWTKEMEQEWLNSLETRFSADDIVAFVDGYDWQDWAGTASNNPNGGWLSTIWA